MVTDLRGLTPDRISYPSYLPALISSGSKQTALMPAFLGHLFEWLVPLTTSFSSLPLPLASATVCIVASVFLR